MKWIAIAAIPRIGRWSWRSTFLRGITSLVVSAAVVVVGTVAGVHVGLRPAVAGAQPRQVPIQPLPVAVLPPELDPFYNAPASSIAETAPGGIIKARQITPAFFNIDALNMDAWQVLYRTNDSHGHAVATVTTLLKPRGTAPRGGRKLLSYQVAEDSTASYCAPSYGMQQGSIPVYSDFVTMLEANLAVLEGISKGYAVSIPDYQGQNSAYGAAILGGQATLDAIRAAENFTPLQLTAGTKTRVGMLGYSGGTIPTGWAAEHAQKYAPELNIVGASIGGVAMADLKAVLIKNNAQVSAGLIGAAFYGFATEYPDVQKVLDTKIDWFGRFMMTTKSLVCRAPLGSAYFPFWNYLGDYNGQQPGGILNEPAVTAAIDANRLGQLRPSMPMYIYQAQNDTLIPNAGTDRLVNWYCRDSRENISYEREYLAEHITGMLTWIPKSYDWIADRLDGKPVKQGCEVTSPYSAISQGDVIRMIVNKWPALAGMLTGQAIGQLPITS